MMDWILGTVRMWSDCGPSPQSQAEYLAERESRLKALLMAAGCAVAGLSLTTVLIRAVRLGLYYKGWID